jgi:hypothetical protein
MKVTLETVLDGNAGGKVSTAMLSRYRFMGEDADIPKIPSDDKMESVQLEFTSIGSQEIQKSIPITELADFNLSREKSTQSGTLKKEKSGRIVLSFTFSAQMMLLAGWVEEHYGNLLNVTVEKAQEELKLEGGGEASEAASNPDSQDARNERILDEEKKDKPAAPSEKRKRGRPKKV